MSLLEQINRCCWHNIFGLQITAHNSDWWGTHPPSLGTSPWAAIMQQSRRIFSLEMQKHPYPQGVVSVIHFAIFDQVTKEFLILLDVLCTCKLGCVLQLSKGCLYFNFQEYQFYSQKLLEALAFSGSMLADAHNSYKLDFSMLCYE